MPRNSFTVPAVVPRTGPSLVGTTGEPPEPEAAVAVPALAAVTPAAPRVSAASAAQQAAASRARRQWIVFMILAPSVSPAGRMPRFRLDGRHATVSSRPCDRTRQILGRHMGGGACTPAEARQIAAVRPLPPDLATAAQAAADAAFTATR
jgi:hypothetical protein